MRRVCGGFTLVEVLVALSVSALMVSLVYGAVRVGQRSANALGVHSSQAEVMRIGWQFLYDALARAQLVPDPKNPDNRTGFQGADNSIEFFADMPAFVGVGGLMRIRLSAEESTDGYRLVLARAHPEQPPTSAFGESDNQAILVEDLDDLRIEYFGPREAKDDPTWHTNWDAAETLPNLIRIAVRPANGQAWPVLVASPLVGTTPLSESVPTTEADEAQSPGAVLP
jgi:general secretion pathway protein J